MIWRRAGVRRIFNSSKCNQSTNGVAKRTVLRIAVSNIAFANDSLGIFKPWPVNSPQVKKFVKSHFKKASKGVLQRASFRHSPENILRMAKAAGDHDSPFVRHILRIEVCKFIGCLRTDDSIHVDSLDFQVNVIDKVIEGRTAKTKSTEQTSGRFFGGDVLPTSPSTFFGFYLVQRLGEGRSQHRYPAWPRLHHSQV